MKNITVTDIFGNYINNTYTPPFLVIHTDRPKLLLDKIVKIGNSTVYKTLIPSVRYILSVYGLDADNFSVLGDVLLSANNNVIKILLINTESEYSITPIDYVQINNISGVNIWKPVCNTGYEAIGYVTSKEKPSINDVRCVRSDITNTLTNNDYNIFGAKRKTDILANDINSMSNYGYSNWYPFSNYEIDSYSNLLESVPPNIEDSVISENDSLGSWITPKGRYVKLTKNTDPWYNFISNQEHIIDQIPKETHVEKKELNIFEEVKDKITNSNNNFYYIISSLILVFIILIMIRYYLQAD